ncbi:MAG: hypothetical protein ACLU99_11760 [Alphaproteobacteria bacterium]
MPRISDGWRTRSNQCDDYLRVRVRKLLPQLAEVLGLSEERIVDTMATLRRSKAYLDEQTERIVKNQVQYFSDDVVAVSAGELLKLHPEMRFRLMARLLKQISGRVYPPRADDLENLCCRMEDAAFKVLLWVVARFVSAMAGFGFFEKKRRLKV